MLPQDLAAKVYEYLVPEDGYWCQNIILHAEKFMAMSHETKTYKELHEPFLGLGVMQKGLK